MRREEENRKEEDKLRRKEEEKAKRDAILEQHKLKKEMERMAEQVFYLGSTPIVCTVCNVQGSPAGLGPWLG